MVPPHPRLSSRSVRRRRDLGVAVGGPLLGIHTAIIRERKARHSVRDNKSLGGISNGMWWRV